MAEPNNCTAGKSYKAPGMGQQTNVERSILIEIVLLRVILFCLTPLSNRRNPMKQKFTEQFRATHLTAPVALILFFGALVPAFADNCSMKDRRPLPRCLSIDERGSGNYSFINDCDYDVVVKVDRPGFDARITSYSGTSVTRHIRGDIREFSCCPRYMAGPCG
jgi:hypothetical protein